MKKQLEQRLAQLETEMAAGQKQLIELEGKREELTNTLLRISGAIQVLKETLEGAENKNDKELIDQVEA